MCEFEYESKAVKLNPDSISRKTGWLGILLQVRFESRFGFEPMGFGFKKIVLDSDSVGFEVPGFGSRFEMPGFTHH